MSKRRKRRSRFTPEVEEARRQEQRSRNGTASARAKSALLQAFPDEYRTLYEAAKAEINAERGPLPGDDA